MVDDITLKNEIAKKLKPFSDCIVLIPKAKKELDKILAIKSVHLVFY